MKKFNLTFRFVLVAICSLLARRTPAAPIPVRHLEGVTFGFLVVHDLEDRVIAYGTLKQVAKPGNPILTDDLQFEFKDGSYFRDVTKFTQRGSFRLLSDHVVQKGPSFKQACESWIDVPSGKVTLRTFDNGTQHDTIKQMKLPPDVANGLFFILVKNMSATAETTVSMITTADKPRIAKLIFHPAEEKAVKVGTLDFKAQHYIMKIKLEGVAGKVAPLVGKQPPDSDFWILKSESPTFIEFEGQMTADSPVWRVELAAPEEDTRGAQTEQK